MGRARVGIEVAKAKAPVQGESRARWSGVVDLAGLPPALVLPAVGKSLGPLAVTLE